MARLETLSAENVDETLAYLARKPYDNVYVGWLIGTRRIERDAALTIWRDEARTVAGVCYYGLQIVPCGARDEAIDALAGAVKRARSARAVIGPRTAVERLWLHARDRLPPPRAVRASQPLYALDPAQLRYGRDEADVARATLPELDEITRHSAEMIAGEIGGDPRNTNADFRGRTARIIESGWWWRYRVDGKLAFMCNVGSTAFGTAQLQGVWTPPALRGRGHAVRAMGAICARLLDEYATLCLYVNDFNTPAIALYERIGFSRAGEFQTILI